MVSALVLLNYNNPAYVFSITPKLNIFIFILFKETKLSKVVFYIVFVLLKGLVHPKMKISPCFTHPQGILGVWLSSFRWIQSEYYSKLSWRDCISGGWRRTPVQRMHVWVSQKPTFVYRSKGSKVSLLYPKENQSPLGLYQNPPTFFFTSPRFVLLIRYRRFVLFSLRARH